MKLVTAMSELPGISYLRTTREKTPTLYGPDEEFPIGGSKIVRRDDADRAVLVGAGVTLHQCLDAELCAILPFIVRKDYTIKSFIVRLFFDLVHFAD